MSAPRAGPLCIRVEQGVAYWAAALDAAEESLNPASGRVYRRLRFPDAPIHVLLQLAADPKAHESGCISISKPDDVEADVRRLEALGATRWRHQQERGHDFWVLRDPWGNEFCVLQTEFPALLAQRQPWPTPPWN